MAHVYRGIHVVKDSYVNVYLIVRNGKAILVDAGLESTWPRVVGYASSIGLALRNLRIIVVTHHHRDHVGSLKKAVEATGALVAAHVDEAELIKSASGVSVSIALRDGDVIESLRIVHTPGHTPGHICLLDEKTKSLFVGDLVYEKNGELHEIPHNYSLDPAMNRESIKKLLQLEFENVMPSHGNPVLRIGKEKLRELVAKLS